MADFSSAQIGAVQSIGSIQAIDSKALDFKVIDSKVIDLKVSNLKNINPSHPLEANKAFPLVAKQIAQQAFINKASANQTDNQINNQIDNRTDNSLALKNSQALGQQDSFYLDTQQLNTLKYTQDSDQGLMQAAKQMEALFVQQMLTRMRRATEAMGSEDNPLSRNKESMFQDMLDNQYAVSMTQTNSFGLADRLYEQLTRRT